ncbi:MAG: hypothetical protein ACXWK5_03090 [Myxococcaceae bacterium]
MRPSLLLLPALLVLQGACGPSGAPGTPPGTASLTVAPETQRVLAGTDPITLRATLVGDTTPVAWAPSGPGTIGATSGPETTYTPPSSVDAETLATVTASAGTGLSAAVQITVAPAGGMDVTGRVVGPTGVALSGLTVGIGTKSVVTGADGRFAIAGVVPPYDLEVVLAGTPTLAGRYEGLTRSDPTIVFLWLFTTGEPNTATIAGTISGGDSVGTAGDFTAAIFSTADVRFDLTAIGVTSRNNPFTLPVAWFGPESITAAVHVLQWKSPRPGQPPTEYTGYGVHEGIALARGAAVEGADVALTAPGNAEIGGTVVPPDGYTVLSKALAVELAGLTAIPLGHVDTADRDFTFAVPEGIPATTSVTAEAQLVGAGTTFRRVSGLAPRRMDVSVALPTPALPVAPADDARDVTAGSEFSWTPLQNGVHFAVFNGGGGAPGVYVVTAGTHTPMPELPGGSTYHWYVGGFGPYDSVDAFTTGANLFPVLGDSVETVSEARSFVVQ